MNTPIPRLRRRARSATGLVVVALAVASTACQDDRTDKRTSATTADPRSQSETPVDAEQPAYRSFIAVAHSDVATIVAYDAPGGAPLQLNRTGDGSLVPAEVSNPLPQLDPNDPLPASAATFLVKTPSRRVGDRTWHEVYLPLRPNGSTGWIDAASVDLQFTDMSISVSLSRRTLEFRDGGKVAGTYPVAIGTAENPTPLGRFYVRELADLSRTDPGGPYGPLAYGLSGFSPTLIDTEAFKEGAIGIHGTNKPDLIGTPVSNGCIRMRNEDILDLESRDLPLGMPVDIFA